MREKPRNKAYEEMMVVLCLLAIPIVIVINALANWLCKIWGITW